MSAVPNRTRTRTKAAGSSRTWPLLDRICLALCWAAGITLCVVAAAIVLFMLWKGLQFVRPELLFSRPESAVDQSKSGGFLDPILGTLLLTTIGVVIAAPL